MICEVHVHPACIINLKQLKMFMYNAKQQPTLLLGTDVQHNHLTWETFIYQMHPNETHLTSLDGVFGICQVPRNQRCSGISLGRMRCPSGELCDFWHFFRSGKKWWSFWCFSWGRWEFSEISNNEICRIGMFDILTSKVGGQYSIYSRDSKVQDCFREHPSSLVFHASLNGWSFKDNFVNQNAEI